MCFPKVLHVIFIASTAVLIRSQDAQDNPPQIDEFESIRSTPEMEQFESVFDSGAGSDVSDINENHMPMQQRRRSDPTPAPAPTPAASRRRSKRRRKSSRRRSKGRRRSGKGGKSGSRRRKSSDSKEMISDAEWDLFWKTRWRHLHAKGHVCATGTSVYPPRCFSSTGRKPCIAGLSDYCEEEVPICTNKALNSIAFDCRLWRAAKTWLDDPSKSEIDKLKAAGIYEELKKVDSKTPGQQIPVYDAPVLNSIHKWGFRVNECCGGCASNAFKHIIHSGWPPGNTAMCHRTGNAWQNVTKLSAVAYVNGCAIQLFSFDSWLPNPKNQGHWLGKLPMETIDQSCIPDKYKDDPQLPPLCRGRKEDMFK
jgi:hypothetical protein